MQKQRGAAVALATLILLTASSLTASATPPEGVSASVLAQTSVGDKDLVLRRITIEPGGSTGWHWHDGNLYGLVKQGTLTHNDADCAVDGVYRTGSFITEPAGEHHVHIGRNLGKTPVVLEVLYVDPKGSPLAESADNPGCKFE